MKTQSLFANIRSTLCLGVLVLLAADGGHLRAQDDARVGDESRRIYVPVEDLSSVIDQDAEGVLLSRKDFDDLLAKANQNSKGDLREPPGIIVSQASYQARVQGDHLLLKATIQFRQFVDAWQVLSLPFSRLAVEKATVNGQPARIGRFSFATPQNAAAAQPSNQKKAVSKQRTQQAKPSKTQIPKTPVLVLYHREPGAATLELELSARLEAVGNDRAARFQLMPIPSATLSVEVPAQRHLQLGAQQLERPAAIDQPATYSIPLGGQRDFTLLFADQQGDQQSDTLTFASTGFGVRVSPGELTWQAVTSLQVIGTTFNQVLCAVPNRLEITGVESTGLESWELADDPDNAESTLITLNYRQPFDGLREITFRGVMAAPTGEPWSVPTLTVRNVTSHIGRVVVQHPASVRVREVELDGARAIAGDAGSLSYGIWKEDFELSFQTQARQRELHPAVTSILELNTNDIVFRGKLQYSTHFEPLFEFRFRLPVAWEVDSLSIDGNPVTTWKAVPVEDDEEWVEYRVPLSQPLQPGTDQIVLFSARQESDDWPIDDGEIELEMPQVRIPESAFVLGSLMIQAGNDLDLTPMELSGLDPRRLNEPGERLGFEFEAEEYSGLLTVSRKPSRISAQTIAFTRLDREVLQSHIQVQIDILGGGVRTVQLGLSESAGDSLRFRPLNSTAQIIEQTSSDPENGIRLWTLQLDRRVAGRLLLAIDCVTPRQGEDEYAAHVVTIPDAERVDGYIAIEGAPDQRITASAVDQQEEPQPLSTIDPAEVTVPRTYSPRERIVAAWKYAVPGYAVTLSEERFDSVAVPSAICHESLVVTVAARTGELQHQAEFEFVAVGSQSLRILLPDGEAGELWAALIDQEPVEVRSSGNSFEVPIPPVGEPDARRTLTLFYRTQTEALKRSGELAQQAPRVSVVHSSGTEQPLQILKQNWTLHYPEDATLTDSSGDYSPVGEFYASSYLGTVRENFLRLDRHTLLQHSTVAVVILVLVFGVALCLRRVGVNIAGIAGGVLTLGILVISMFGLFQLATSESESAKNFTASMSEEDNRLLDAASPSDLTGAIGHDFPDTEMAESEESSQPQTRISLDGRELAANEAGGFGGGRGVTQFRAGTQREFTGQDKFPGNGTMIGLSTNRPQVTDQEADDQPQPAAPQVGNESGFTTARPESAASAPGAAGNLPGQPRSGDGGAAPVPQAPNADRPAMIAGRAASPQAEGEPDPAVAQQLMAQAEQPADGPGEPQAGGTRPTRGRGGRMGGLLSLSLDLEIPENSKEHGFLYTGNRTSADGVSLKVVWQDSRAADFGRAFLGLAVALVLWLTMSSSRKTRAILVSAGLTIPLALVSVASARFHVVLDGIFLGTLLVLGLWVVRSVCGWLKTVRFSRNRRPAKTTSSAAQTAGLWLVPVLGLALSSDVAIAQNSAPVSGDNTERSRPRRTGIVIPYQAGQSPLDADRVLLTRQQFLDLWNRANPDERLKPPAPVGGVVADALYECALAVAGNGNADGEDGTGRLDVKATIILHNFLDRQITLPVPLGRIAVRAARLNDNPAPLRINQTKLGPQLAVVLSKTGSHVLDLEFSVPAKVTGAAGQFTLPVLPVPSGRVTFQLPQPELAIRVNGSTSAYRLVTRDDTQSIEIPIGDGKPLSVAWRPPQERGAVDAIVQVENATSVLMDDAGISETSRVDIRVPQGSISDLSFRVPDPLRIQALSGSHLAGWEAVGDGDDRRVRVFFSPPVTKATQIEVKLFIDQALSDEEVPITIPTIAALDVTRETGRIGILTTDDYSARAGAVDGLTRLDVTGKLQIPMIAPSSQLPATARLAWRYVGRPFSLQVIAGRRVPDSVAVVEHAARVLRRRVDIASRMKAKLKGAARTAISFQLPEEYQLSEVEATGLGDWYVTESDDNNPKTLTIEFVQPLIGDVDVALTGRISKAPEDLYVEPLVPMPLEIGDLTAWVGVWFDEAYSAKLSDSIGWVEVDPDRVPASLRAMQQSPLKFAFRSEPEDEPLLAFDIIKATPELEADVLVIATVADTFLDYSLFLKWEVSDAAVDEFSFTTPESLEGRLSFYRPGIRDVQTEPAEEGRIRWTISLHEAVRDRYVALANAILPPIQERLGVPRVVFVSPLIDEDGETMDFATVESQRQFAMLVNQSQAQLTADHSDGVTDVSPQDLPFTVHESIQNQAAAVLRVRGAQAKPGWTLQRYEQQNGAPASIRRADLTLAIAEDGSWRGRAVYTMRNRRRQFLGLRMPENSRLMSLFVQDQPSRPVTTQLDGKQVQLVPLPRTGRADLQFNVQVTYAGSFGDTLPTGFTVQSRDLQLPAPHVVTTQESEQYGIPVAKTEWTVWLPDSVDASLIEDAARSNLKPTQQFGIEGYASDLVQDANDMLLVLEDERASARERMQAANNLKQLRLGLDSYRRGSSGGVDVGDIRKQRMVSGKTQEKIEEVQSKIVGNTLIDSLAEQSTVQAVPQEKFAEEQRLVLRNNAQFLFDNTPGTMSEDINGNGILDLGEDLNNNGVLDVAQRDLGGEQAERSGKESDSRGFRFRLEATAPEKPGGKGKFSKKLQEKSKEAQARKSESRKQRRDQSISNFEGFNRFSGQQGQRPGRPMVPFGSVGGALQGRQGQQGSGQQQANQTTDPFTQNDQGALIEELDALPQIRGEREFANAPAQAAADADNDQDGERPVAMLWSIEESAVRGLSVDMTIPLGDNSLSFSKVSGQPKLALRIRSRELVDSSVGLVWTIGWLGVGFALVIVAIRLSNGSNAWKPVSWILFGAGLLIFILLPPPLSAIGFIAFLIGAGAVAVRYVRSAPQPAS